MIASDGCLIMKHSCANSIFVLSFVQYVNFHCIVIVSIFCMFDMIAWYFVLLFIQMNDIWTHLILSLRLFVHLTASATISFILSVVIQKVDYIVPWKGRFWHALWFLPLGAKAVEAINNFGPHSTPVHLRIFWSSTITYISAPPWINRLTIPRALLSYYPLERSLAMTMPSLHGCEL